MTRPKGILAITAASLGGLLLLLIIASLIIVQTSWFANFVRDKIVATLEESTGGTVEIGSFQFDPWHLTARIRNFVLHGTEAKTESPLAQASLLEIHLKLFSGIYHAVDLAYIGLDRPQVNLIAYPNGSTNIPQPKIPQKPSDTNSLETIVDLKIGEFRIQNGLIRFLQQQTSFNARGENLHALLNYNTLNPSYSGTLAIDPLLVSQAPGQPLRVHVNLPVSIDKNTVTLKNGTLATAGSNIAINASLSQINTPVIDGQINAVVSLPEVAGSFGLPLDTTSPGLPRQLTAELAAHVDQKTNAMELRTAHIGLGDTTFQASGTLRNPNNPAAAAQFNGNLALAQLSKLLKVTSPQVNGSVDINGNARLDAQNNYQVNGTLNSKGLALRQDTTHINNVSLYTPFHADPFLVSLDGLKLTALGGSLGAKVFLENMQNLSVEGNLRNFSLPVLASVFTGKRLDYGATINGSLRARGDLKAKGTTGVNANANLSVTPEREGVPLHGQLTASYVGASDSVDLGHSFIAFPSSRLDLSGALNKRLDLKLVSHNLNDFLPAANFGAKQPDTSLPLVLQGDGTASLTAAVNGNLANPSIAGHLAVNNFAVQKSSFDSLALDVTASPRSAAIQNGSLTRNTLHTAFDASIGLRKWSPLPNSPVRANLTLRNASVTDLLNLAGQSSVPASGDATADVHINGTYGNPLGSAVVQIANATAYNQPFNRVYAQVNLADGAVNLAPLEVGTDAGTLDINATYQHPRNSFTVGNAQVHVRSTTIDLAKLKGLQSRSPGLGGALQLTADAAASVREVNNKSAVDVSNVSADFSARNMRVQHQDAGDLTLTARTQNRTVTYNVASNLAGSNIAVNGHTALTADYLTAADADIENLSVQKTLSLAGQATIPATGTLSAKAHVAGTLNAPDAQLSFALASAKVYGETINRLGGSLHYTDRLVDVPSIQLDVPAGSVTLAASFSHPANDFNSGAVKLNVKSTDIDLARIQHVRESQPTLAGTVHLAADISADVRQQAGARSVLLHNVNADLGTNGLQLQHRDLGAASLVARTANSAVQFHFDSDIAKSQIHANGTSQLTTDYPTDANLTFANIKYSNIAPYISSEPTIQPAFDALVEGKASVNGPLLNSDKLSARLQLDKLQAQTVAGRSPTGGRGGRTVNIDNQGPILVTFNHSVLNVEQFHLKGPDTNLDVSGGVNLNNQTAPMSIHLGANANLALLGDVDNEIYSSGTLALDAAIHGSFSQPLANGRIELKNANVNYAELPNGVSNANGVILLTGTGANIQNLTAESGGGKISLTGFAGFNGQAVTYNVKAAANSVRVRYSGISVTSNATITLLGNTNRSLVSGNVTVNRIAYNSSSDAGSLLSSFASTPPSVETAPSPILASTRLDIHILTAPDLRVVTTYADRLAVEANLTIRGTAVDPGILGRVVITDGQLVFFGNTYTVNTGTINFYNPTSIQPVVNISLETLTQGVDVTLGVSGPMNNLQLSYTSDPPLSFEQIVELLATNTTPNDPNIVANQPQAPQQSFTQMGESAILGQAVADPLASRVQRVFGLSQFKIDPSVAGSNGQPSARVTLQQKIANNITFTYITDVTQTNSEIIRVQWDLTPKFSAVGLRDYNGNVSLEFTYKFVKR